jgi:hypothetical protein
MSRAARCAIAAALVLLVVAAFWGVSTAGYLSLDDTGYLVENPRMRDGLTWKNVQYAYRTTCVGNWIPLTWMSHMLVVDLLGMGAAGHHLVNLGLHALTAVLLFLLLARLLGRTWVAALVAALFAVHPLRVESVAWISERKDVLSGALGMVTLGAYLRYARRPGWGRALPVLLAWAAALQAKPMAVSLPVVMALLDWWPLNRLGGRNGWGLRHGPRRVLLEKLALAALAGAFSLWTVAWQRRVHSITSDLFPLGLRLANAAVASVTYLGKALWPAKLSIFYPYPASIPAWHTAGALLLLAGVSAAAWSQRAARPWLLFGWLWYLGTLFPVSGVVQVGLQSMADRYTYLPLIGPALALALLAAEFARRGRIVPWAAGAAAAVLVGGLASATAAEVRHWRSSETVYRHALEADPDNWFARRGIGDQLAARGRIPEALAAYEQAVRAGYLRGDLLRKIVRLYEIQGRYDEADRAALELEALRGRQFLGPDR